MRAVVKLIGMYPIPEKAFKWGKLITITGGAQFVVQITGLISGIIIVRILPIHEYALYILSNTILGMLTVLADGGGISIGVMAQGGKVWQDKTKLGAVLSTGLMLRKKFAIGGLLLSIPILIYLLLQHGATLETTVLIFLSLVPAVYAAITDSLLEVIPKLHQDIISLQRNQISVSIGRLILCSSTLLLFPFTYVAIIANSLPRIYGNFCLYKISNLYSDKHQKPDKETEKEIIRVVKRLLPGAIYYCFSGQITIWLISLFGTTNNIAEIGAIGRLSVILSFFSTIFSTILIPRFARLPEDKLILLRRFIQIMVLLLLLCGCTVLVVSIFSNYLLWILGPNYKNLNRELILNTIAGCIGLIAGAAFFLHSGRGWIPNPIITISINVTAIILGGVFFNISSLQEVIFFNIFINSVYALREIIYCIFKIKRLPVS